GRFRNRGRGCSGRGRSSRRREHGHAGVLEHFAPVASTPPRTAPNPLASAGMSDRAPDISIQHLPYVDRLGPREPASIDAVVIHCTELPDMAMAREYGERILYPEAGTGAAGHWYVDRDGSITEYVPAARIAHHVRGWNPRSVGIELVNTGRFPNWDDSRHRAMAEPDPPGQAEGLVRLRRRPGTALPALRRIAR